MASAYTLGVSVALVIALFIGFVVALKLVGKVETEFNRRMLPELRYFPKAERMRALARARPSVRIFLYLTGLASLTFVTVPYEWIAARFGRLGLILFGSTVLSMLGMLVMWTVRNRIRRALRVELLERGVPICVNCGYDTRALPEPRCPECGESL